MLSAIMSEWRHEAAKRLPELQFKIVASPSVHTPAELWLALNMEFDRLCRAEWPPIDLLSRIWQYAKWCLDRKDDNVKEAVVSLFFDLIQDTRRYREVLPKFMSIDEYEQICGLRTPKTKTER